VTDAADLAGTAPPQAIDEPRESPWLRLRSVFAGTGSLDLRNTWQLAVGAIFMPLGLVIILLAWYGSAHTAYVQQQIPYLVSGSFIGLGLMIVGGLLFWAHWMYRIYDQADLHHRELLRQQEDTMRAFVEALSGTTANGRSTARPAAPPSGAAPRFVATSSGSNFHVESCPVVARSRNKLRTVSAREAASMQPCRICDPLHAAAQA